METTIKFQVLTFQTSFNFLKILALKSNNTLRRINNRIMWEKLF